MRNLLFKTIFTFAIAVFLTYPVFGQKILVAENKNTLKNFKYITGRILTFRADGEKISDVLTDMDDSTLYFSSSGAIPLGEIEALYRPNWLIGILSGVSMLGGGAYLALDSFNRLINGEGPVIQQETLIISGSMLAFGAVLIPFYDRKLPVTRWKLRVIDLSL
jgi:hypothetical protein